MEKSTHTGSIKLERCTTLHNDIAEIPLLAAFVDDVCESVGIDLPVVMQINLAMEESVVNVMNYAYPVGEQGNVDIRASVTDDWLTFVIVDSGVPFDPTAKEDPDITLGLEERPIGGLGIHLTRQLMDVIRYEYADGKNVLTLQKKLQ